jgi:hypothetical protein
VPAAFVWTNALGNGLSWLPQNWVNQSGGGVGSPPGPGDDLIFDGNVSHNSCYGLRGHGLPENQADFASLSLINEYGGTVQIASDGTAGIAVEELNLASGAIAQPNAITTQLTVLDQFTWTGGFLGESSADVSTFTPSHGVVNIAGAGTITLSNNNTLYCGSTLNFTNPTAAAVETVISGLGTLFLNGGNGITVGADAKVEVIVDENTNTWIKNDTTKTLTLLTGSRGWEYRGQGSRELDLRVINYGGRFYLNGQVTLALKGGNAQTPAYTQTPLLFGNPLLEIKNGSVLDVSTSKGVQINGGRVWLTSNAGLPSDKQFATIKGNYTMTGGELGFHLSPIQIGDRLVWCTFKVQGDVFWSGGTYLPGVDGSAEGNMVSNLWFITGTLSIDASQPSKPTIGPVPQYVPNGQQLPRWQWEVITANNIQGDNPSIPPGWTLLPVIDSNGVKKKFRIEYTGS